MTVLIVGASGATGRHLADQLLKRNIEVRIIVRDKSNLPDILQNRNKLNVYEASILEMTDDELKELVKGCDALASCLGHNLNFRGIWGEPHRLVSEAVKKLCSIASTFQPEIPVKMVLMNTSGNRNRSLNEKSFFGQRLVTGLVRLLLPPHRDNEEAAEYLRTGIERSTRSVRWVVVRPDTLTNETEPDSYELYPSPIRNVIFNPGKTSRVNVGCFMADLITDSVLWEKWEGQMPVIYNQN